MSHDHSEEHSHGKDASAKRLLVALALNVGITAAQVVGSLIGSLQAGNERR